MKYIKLILLLTVIVSCKSSKTNTIIYPEDIFTKSEVEEISLMLKEFTKIVCASTSVNSTDCIKTYFENYWSNFSNGHIKTQIDSTSLDKIIDPLSDDLKSKLFSKNISPVENRIPHTTPYLAIPDTIQYLFVNTRQSYIPMINYLSKKYPALNDVKETYSKLQSLASYNVRTIYSNWDNYDYSENTELLFLSLMIISQTDESIKRELSYSTAIKPIEKSLKERYNDKN